MLVSNPKILQFLYDNLFKTKSKEIDKILAPNIENPSLFSPPRDGVLAEKLHHRFDSEQIPFQKTPWSKKPSRNPSNLLTTHTSLTGTHNKRKDLTDAKEIA